MTQLNWGGGNICVIKIYIDGHLGIIRIILFHYITNGKLETLIIFKNKYPHNWLKKD